MRCFEDFVTGDEHQLGQVSMTEEEIIGYARQWDPMPFHTDEAAASAGPFGKLVASGNHTTAHATRLYVSQLLADSACRGSYGLDEVRYLRPVFAGDVLAVRAEVEQAVGHPRRPDTGVVHLLVAAAGADGEDVLTLRTRVLVGRREAVAG
ncbi:MaoC/PaaZ C-terminal domain-containing protein [Amycolatopsis regifaucium]|uniref:MaoC-like domain-containing protein n=1 Tax=Amycolatopsis regifaucium TaxID=546365 RepID=A0A154M3J7_9PSEU|nr:MaoC/PaaZ C-terminal domain-containing protein [Amycolatopsis regifaucium]KZB79184.1 hypothetical protein AVL48_16405 [Amycolatopsis regifaucium]OKA07368.1 hypothetical protein ATP06_0216090 [Amycolatopsis regifaucium]SFH13285.1 Acyl dehydratase [Amycolatopsis regifaucium]